MPKLLWSKKFDVKGSYVWRKGENVGEPVVNKDFTERRLRQLYDGRSIVYSDVWKQFVGAAKSPAPAKGLPVVDPAPIDNGESDLRSELESLGVKVDKRWGEARLIEELEKATAPTAVLPGVNDGAA